MTVGIVRAEYQQLYNRYINQKYEKFDGDAREICEQIITKLWEGDFYRTSLGHFNFFWMRDFGTVAESLTKLGHGDNVRHTLNWAMLHYMKIDHVTLCIDVNGNPFNAPVKQSIDALPWLLHSLVVSEYNLRPMEQSFLNAHLYRYTRKYLDPATGDLKPGVRYAELRDAVNYDRSAYAITMIARMAECAKLLELDFPFDAETYRTILNEAYWNGRFFKADRATDVWSSECGLMPFHLGIITDKAKADKTFDFLRATQYEKLYPLEYCKHWDEFNYRPGMGSWLMRNYTGTTIWTWHGTFYLHSLKRFNRPEYDEEYQKFCQLIERHKTYPEMLNPDGSWYKSPIYSGDPGMVWAALFLDLPVS